MADVVMAKDVRKSFPLGRGGSRSEVEVLRGISLSVAAGEMVSVVGPSGSGKSTLLYCLSGLMRPSSGEVVLAGTPLERASRAQAARLRAAHVGFVFQQYGLVESLSVEENVLLPARLAGRRESRRHALEALARVGMDRFRGCRPQDLSGGEQQRVAIARALAARPDAVFADEPSGALDIENGHVVLDLLRKIADEGGAVVLVTHDLEAASRADRVIVLRDGRVGDELGHASPREILSALEGARGAVTL